ncbi:MAG TPA: hypothetical protein VGC76_11315 [Pyrinomonadaceae bacterium]|jgi:hypothetical protein
MKSRVLLALILLCSISIQAQIKKNYSVNKVKAAAVSNQAANADVLPIRRVILYSNGVAYVERRGIISGKAEINLSFKQSQVDDVLKSMVVLDLGQGRIGAVSYNSSAPVSAQMSEIPFSVNSITDQTAGGGLAGVLSQLQGAKVSVASTKGAAVGSILTVERRSAQIDSTKPPVITHFLVIASESGEISSFDLADVRSVKLLEEGTKRDVTEFANATSFSRRRDAKTITVTSDGAGQREMVVSYIIAAPIWKTTYRVVLDEAGKPFFQGWAIVDNVSDEDWQNVQLSLVSGSPISFVQPIQQPFYRYRPVVPIPNDLRLTPQIYEPQSRIDVSDNKINTNITAQTNEILPAGTNFSSLLKVSPNVKPEALAGGLQIDGASGNSNTYVVDGQEVSNFRTGVLSTTVSQALLANQSGVSTAATGEEVGDLFEYKIEQPVTVMRDRSALIPIVQTKMEGERVTIYNEAVRQDRPLSGLLLQNTTNLTLESGSLTVIDRDAYAGEALMDRLKPKEQRLISFALDLGTHVRVRPLENREPVKLTKVINGVFEVHYFRTEEKLYQIENQTEHAKVLYIEYPIRDGWQLSDTTPKPDYTTQRYYRFRVELKPFETKEMTVSERIPLMDSYQISALTKADLALFLTRRYIDEKTRAKLEKLIDLRTSISQVESKLEGFNDEVEQISDDQKRLRENIEALSKTAEAKTLITRYIEKVNQQESRLEEIEKERRNLAIEKQSKEAELLNEIRTFSID